MSVLIGNSLVEKADVGRSRISRKRSISSRQLRSRLYDFVCHRIQEARRNSSYSRTAPRFIRQRQTQFSVDERALRRKRLPPRREGRRARSSGRPIDPPAPRPIGGTSASVLYAGADPTLVAGVLQVNVTVPANAPIGPSVPIQISVGGVTSRSGITVALK